MRCKVTVSVKCEPFFFYQPTISEAYNPTPHLLSASLLPSLLYCFSTGPFSMIFGKDCPALLGGQSCFCPAFVDVNWPCRLPETPYFWNVPPSRRSFSNTKIMNFSGCYSITRLPCFLLRIPRDYELVSEQS